MKLINLESNIYTVKNDYTLIDRNILQAYFNTKYIFFTENNNEYVIYLDKFLSADLQNWFKDYSIVSGCFITAFNPFSQINSPSINRSNQQQFEADVIEAGFRYFTGLGQSFDDNWSEESILIVNISLNESIDFAIKYKQNAFVFINSLSELPKLVLLR